MKKKISYNEYVEMVEEEYNKLGGVVRRGQLYSNFLYMINSDLASEIHELIDPYYIDENLSPFLEYVERYMPE